MVERNSQQSGRFDGYLKLSEALPEAFARTWPGLDPGTQILLGLLLLRSHHIDALPITLVGEGRVHFISGYSCLNELAHTTTVDYGKFFRLTCDNVSIELPIASAGENLSSLLKIFSETQFGFAWASRDDYHDGAFIRLADLLPLYDKGILSTKLSIGYVSSRNVFSLDKDSSLKTAIEEMIRQRRRRILMTGDRTIISDREIISFLFSEPRLKSVLANPSTLLDGKLKDVVGVTPIKLGVDMPLNEAAHLLLDDPGVGICESGIVTPWDIIMKPWRENDLLIRD